MFGLGWPEVAVISVVAIALFGAKKLPELGRSMGQTVRGFRDEIQGDGEPESSTEEES